MVKTKEISKQQFFSLEKTNALKGLFAVFVLIHHIGQNTTFLNGTFFENVVNSLGYLSVSVFLFLSGYGLAVSHKLKGEKYINTFPKAKILPFYLQNLILIAIYLVFWTIIGKTLPTKRIVLSFLFGHTVIKYGWYLQATLFLYILFFIGFKFKSKLSKIIAFVLGYTLYFGYCIINQFWTMWYVSILAFAVGIIYSNIKLKSKYCLPILTVLFIALYILSNLKSLNDVSVIFKMSASVIFPLLIVLIFDIIPLKFKFLNKLSKISFEIYVSQGLFFSLFHSSLIRIKNEALYITAVVVSTVLFSILLSYLFKLVSPKKRTVKQ